MHYDIPAPIQPVYQYRVEWYDGRGIRHFQLFDDSSECDRAYHHLVCLSELIHDDFQLVSRSRRIKPIPEGHWEKI